MVDQSLLRVSLFDTTLGKKKQLF